MCRWIEGTCLYGEGDWYGEHVRLRPWQRELIYRLYEYWPETGRRRYRRGLWGLPKMNGKTPLAAFVGAYELAGGRQRFPRVIIGAASLGQADLVFGDLKAAVTGTEATPSPLREFVDAFDLEVQLRDRPGLAERIAAVARTNDGSRATAFIADELHEWTGRTARVFMIVEGAIAKRADAFTLSISTAGFDDDDLLVKQQYDYGVKLASGEVVDDETLFVWWEASESWDLDDPEQWAAAVREANPAVDDFCRMEAIKSRFDGALRMPRHEFERYHLNRFVKPGEVWEVAAVWDDLADPSIELDPARPAFVGVDVGLRHDSSAVLIAQRLEDGRVVVRSRIWENPFAYDDRRHDEWTLNITEVANHLRELRRAYPKRARKAAGPAFFYDKTFFEESAAALEGEKLNMLDYPQTDTRMVPASTTLFQLAMDGRLVHDGDAALSRHVKAVVPHERVAGWRISKPKGSRTHIDGAVALAIAAHEATRPDRRRRGTLAV